MKDRSENLQFNRLEAVDLFHKLAYRFEKVYKLGKEKPEQSKAINLEIINLICENSEEVSRDSTILFYCVFFCIYHANMDIYNFLKTLMSKLQNDD